MKAGIAMANRSFQCVLCQRQFTRFGPDASLLSANLVCDDCLTELRQLEGDELRVQVSKRLAEGMSHRDQELESTIIKIVQEHAQRLGRSG